MPWTIVIGLICTNLAILGASHSSRSSNKQNWRTTQEYDSWEKPPSPYSYVNRLMQMGIYTYITNIYIYISNDIAIYIYIYIYIYVYYHIWYVDNNQYSHMYVYIICIYNINNNNNHHNNNHNNNNIVPYFILTIIFHEIPMFHGEWNHPWLKKTRAIAHLTLWLCQYITNWKDPP